ncbi:MAG: hypothetical protein CL675_06920 [Bdellovibrionaceae bacterium]|nr:hypothetical protein [Pseudobdellovibrionaceae bacterium]
MKSMSVLRRSITAKPVLLLTLLVLLTAHVSAGEIVNCPDVFGVATAPDADKKTSSLLKVLKLDRYGPIRNAIRDLRPFIGGSASRPRLAWIIQLISQGDDKDLFLSRDRYNQLDHAAVAGGYEQGFRPFYDIESFLFDQFFNKRADEFKNDPDFISDSVEILTRSFFEKRDSHGTVLDFLVRFISDFDPSGRWLSKILISSDYIELDEWRRNLNLAERIVLNGAATSAQLQVVSNFADRAYRFLHPERFDIGHDILAQYNEVVAELTRKTGETLNVLNVITEPPGRPESGLVGDVERPIWRRKSDNSLAAVFDASAERYSHNYTGNYQGVLADQRLLVEGEYKKGMRVGEWILYFTGEGQKVPVMSAGFSVESLHGGRSFMHRIDLLSKPFSAEIVEALTASFNQVSSEHDVAFVAIASALAVKTNRVTDARLAKPLLQMHRHYLNGSFTGGSSVLDGGWVGHDFFEPALQRLGALYPDALAEAEASVPGRGLSDISRQLGDAYVPSLLKLLKMAPQKSRAVIEAAIASSQPGGESSKKVLEVILAEFRVEPRNWILPLLKMIRPLPDQEVRIFNEIRDVSKKDPAILFLAVESMFRFASENAGKLFLHAVRTVHPDSGEVYQDAAVFDESMLFGLGQAVDLSPERLRLEDVRKGLEILKERSPSPLWREAAASNLEGAKTFPIRSPLSF